LAFGGVVDIHIEANRPGGFSIESIGDMYGLWV